MKNLLLQPTRIQSTIINNFFERVEAYDSICIFRHQNPDGDAFGSQCGLKSALNLLYPKKNIYVLGESEPRLSLFPKMDEVSDETVTQSLGIVLDCANRARIDDQRFETCKELIKIDHHPDVDVYGDFSYVNPTRSSTCEIITDFLFDKDCLDSVGASYLLAGMMTDTIRFSVESTTADTLMYAAYLMNAGANISQLSQRFFSKDLARYENELRLAHHIQYRDGVAWLIITTQLRNSLRLSINEAKLYNNIMSGIKEYKIWAIFVEEDSGSYLGSLRSQEATINTIAARYNGGGHRLACGVRGLSESDVQSIVLELMDAQRHLN